eukprot:GDKI01017083.1.p1 GENE.GDKI01017083.1~~GDKI01017083.1.p1  ORF type:complete len:122 (-),score=36.43 GDKI01017083.1:6-371(-)
MACTAARAPVTGAVPRDGKFPTAGDGNKKGGGGRRRRYDWKFPSPSPDEQKPVEKLPSPSVDVKQQQPLAAGLANIPPTSLRRHSSKGRSSSNSRHRSLAEKIHTPEGTVGGGGVCVCGVV